MKYRKRPVIVEAVRFTYENRKVVESFGNGTITIEYYDGAWKAGAGPVTIHAIVKTLEGEMMAREGDYIIKGVNGEFYPCKPDIFEKTYEEIKERDEK